MSPLFLDGATVKTDCCAAEAKDVQNSQISDYELYQYLPVPCDNNTIMRSPDFQYDHVNLRANIGYGLSDSCTIDRYSALRNDPAQMTRDKCRTQLFTRVFWNVPNLKPGVPDSDAEMPVIQGIDSRELAGVAYPCARALSEVDYDRFTPLLPCLKDNIQNQKHIVPPWQWGGENSRETMRQQDFQQSCRSTYGQPGNVGRP